jgi:osmotically-inducible protein OsmY
MRRNQYRETINPSRGRNLNNGYGFNRGFGRLDIQGSREIDVRQGGMDVPMTNPYDMADDEFRDEDELYVAQDYDQRDSERYEDLVPQNRGQHYGKGPKNWKRSDLQLREEVCEALYLNEDLDASDIEVDVQEGVVTLSGFVNSRSSKRLAEDIIDDISGVLDIQNLLAIKASPPRPNRTETSVEWGYPVQE